MVEQFVIQKQLIKKTVKNGEHFVKRLKQDMHLKGGQLKKMEKVLKSLRILMQKKI